MAFPLVLGYNSTLTATTTTGPTAVQMDVSKLLNKFREPIEIVAMQFYVGTTIGYLGNAIQIKLDVQRNQITNGYIPIGLLGAPVQAQAVLNGTIPILGAYGTEESTLGYGSYLVGYYRWRLPKPLFLDGGQAINASFLYDPSSLCTPLLGSTKFNFGVALTARYLPNAKLPKVRPVPYVTAFLGSSTNLKGSVDIFKNPFPTPLEVERFTGRYFGLATYGGTTYHVDATSSPGVGDKLIELRSAKNVMNTVVPTPFNQVFPALHRSWYCPHTLPGSSDYHRINLLTAPLATERPQIAMIGTRNEVF